MTAYRSRRETLQYRQHLKNASPQVCVFCIIQKGNSAYIEETPTFKVIKNSFPYSLWDGQHVEDHLMITPKGHTDSLGSMSPKAKSEYVDLLEKYEKKGYNIYARAPQSVIKTIIHQHTHLIKSVDEPKRFLFFLRKPYIRFIR